MKNTVLEDYTVREIKLFTALGMEQYLPQVKPMHMWKFAIETAFIESKAGPAVEALRRGARILFVDNGYRRNEEFDTAIQF